VSMVLVAVSLTKVELLARRWVRGGGSFCSETRFLT